MPHVLHGARDWSTEVHELVKDATVTIFHCLFELIHSKIFGTVFCKDLSSHLSPQEISHEEYEA